MPIYDCTKETGSTYATKEGQKTLSLEKASRLTRAKSTA